MNEALIHLAFLGVGAGVVGEYHLLDLTDKGSVAVRDDPQQIEVLDREMVGVVLEGSAHRREIGLGQRGDQRWSVGEVAFDRGDGAVDHRDRVEALRPVKRWEVMVFVRNAAPSDWPRGSG